MLDPTPAPRVGHTIPDVSDQKNLQCDDTVNELVSPKLPSSAKEFKEAQKTPAKPSSRVFNRDLADPSTRSPSEAFSDMAKAAEQEIKEPGAKRLSANPLPPTRSPASPFTGPTLHQISDEKTAEC